MEKNMNRNMRAGFQGKRDAMRELADKLMGSGQAEQKPHMQQYKKGGAVKSGANPKKQRRSCNRKKQ